MKLNVHPYKLELIEPFVISHGTFHYRDTLIVEVVHDGINGFGEATAISYYGMNIEDFTNRMNEVKSSFEQMEWDHPKSLWPAIQQLLPDNTFLQSAVDCALWDIHGKKEGVQLHEMWHNKSTQLPLGSFTLSGSPEGVAYKLQTMEWPLYKIKMGTKQDDEILQCIRQNKGDANVIIDANGGWDLESAKYYSKELKKLGIQFIEQPLPPGQEELMAQLQTKGIDRYADESAQGMDAIEKCAAYFDGINFKLMKSGGITPVLENIEEARESGLKVALGCMTESSFGISALAQLAPLVDSIDMDGNLLIKNDPGQGVHLEKGEIRYGEGVGIGCQWRD